LYKFLDIHVIVVLFFLILVVIFHFLVAMYLNDVPNFEFFHSEKFRFIIKKKRRNLLFFVFTSFIRSSFFSLSNLLKLLSRVLINCKFVS